MLFLDRVGWCWVVLGPQEQSQSQSAPSPRSQAKALLRQQEQERQSSYRTSDGETPCSFLSSAESFQDLK